VLVNLAEKAGNLSAQANVNFGSALKDLNLFKPKKTSVGAVSSAEMQ